MTTLRMTRDELIADLPKAYRQQNNIDGMNNIALLVAWKRFGIHAGTWDWDRVEVMK